MADRDKDKTRKRMTVRLDASLHREVEAAARRFRFASMNELSVAALRVALDMMARGVSVGAVSSSVEEEVCEEFAMYGRAEVQPQDVVPTRRRRRSRGDGDA